MSNQASGGCYCGAVRFTFKLPSLWCAHCHCSMCRRTHGAAFVTWVGVAEERFKIQMGDRDLVRFASSHEAVRSFCRHCGSTLFFQSERWPGEVHIALANIDTPIDCQPQSHVYWNDHVEWGDWCGKELAKKG